MCIGGALMKMGEPMLVFHGGSIRDRDVGIREESAQTFWALYNQYQQQVTMRETLKQDNDGGSAVDSLFVRKHPCDDLSLDLRTMDHLRHPYRRVRPLVRQIAQL
jgi:hypothetical protein